MSCHSNGEDSYAVDYFHGRHDAFFLTHVHSDHLSGLHDDWKRGIIYCSEQTKKILMKTFRLDRRLVQALDVDCPQSIVLHKSSVTVTFLDANHCPGSVMIKIVGDFGSRLHSGDFRFCEHIFGQYISNHLFGIQSVFLDTTFFHPSWSMPSKPVACELMIDLIDRQPSDSKVYLASDCYGQEDIFIAINRRYGQKIILNVDHLGISARTRFIWENWLKNVSCLHDVVTKDLDEPSRFYACASNGKGIPKSLRENALNIFALAKRQEPGILIRASTLWFGSRDRFDNHERIERLHKLF